MNKLILYILLCILGINLAYASYCYQESANVSNQVGNDGTCNLVYTGSYHHSNSAGWTSISLLTDGDYTTAGYLPNAGRNDSYYINYTIPYNIVNNVLWQINESIQSTYYNNISIPSDCYLGSSKLQLLINLTYSNPNKVISDMCYNYSSSNWIVLYTMSSVLSYSRWIAEEGIYWNASSYTSCYQEDVIIENQTGIDGGYGNCGLNYTGYLNYAPADFNSDGDAIHDGDWTTYDYPYSDGSMNYYEIIQKPDVPTTTNSKVIFKAGSTLVSSNFSNFPDCYIQNPITLRYDVYKNSTTNFNYIRLYCYNSTTYKEMALSSLGSQYDQFYESAMIWSRNPHNITQPLNNSYYNYTPTFKGYLHEIVPYGGSYEYRTMDLNSFNGGYLPDGAFYNIANFIYGIGITNFSFIPSSRRGSNVIYTVLYDEEYQAIYESFTNYTYDDLKPIINIDKPIQNQSFFNVKSMLVNLTLTDVNLKSARYDNGSTIAYPYISIPSVFSDYCYQENASNITACGGLATGSYSCSGDVNCNFAYDGNWSSYINLDDVVTIYANYSIPNNTFLSLLKIKLGNGIITNITIPDRCIVNRSSLNLYFRTDYGAYNFWCYDNTTAVRIMGATIAPNSIYDMAVYWQIARTINANFTYTPIIGRNSLNIYANDSAGNSNSNSVSFKVKNITSNYTLFNMTHPNESISVYVKALGFDSNYTCTITSSVYGVLSCDSTNTDIVTCNAIGTQKDVSTAIRPLCTDTESYHPEDYSTVYMNSRYLRILNISIFDAGNFSKITQPVTMRVTSDISDNTYVVTNGIFNITDLSYGEYQFRFNTSNYAVQHYDILINQPSLQNLSAYLILNATALSTVFTIKDSDSGAYVPTARLQMYSLINNTWTLIASQLTDYTGKTPIYYLTDNQYKFNITKAGYLDNIFFLNPIIYTTYDIYISKSSTLNGTMNLDKINIVYPTGILYNGSTNDFTVTFSSPYSSLTGYGYTLDYPVGSATVLGSNPMGSSLTTTIQINSNSPYDYAELNYFYAIGSEMKNFTVNIPIIYNITKGTFMGIKSNTYGLGIFERVLIATIISIFVVGISAMIGQVLAGLTICLVVLAYLTVIGFVPVWAVILSGIIGFFILIWRTGGY